MKYDAGPHSATSLSQVGAIHAVKLLVNLSLRRGRLHMESGSKANRDRDFAIRIEMQ